MDHIQGGPMAGRTVLVTGATSSIERATALGLATMGSHVAMTDRDLGRTENAAREISAAGGRNVEMFVADLSSQAQVRRLTGEVLEGLPRRIQRLLIPFLRPVLTSPAQGDATSIHLTSALELQQVSGRYFANRRPTRSTTRNYDQAVAARLWEASADLVELTAAPRV